MHRNQCRRIHGTVLALALAFIGLLPGLARADAAPVARAHPWLAMIFGVVEDPSEVIPNPPRLALQHPVCMAAVLNERWLLAVSDTWCGSVATPYALFKDTWKPSDVMTDMWRTVRKVVIGDFLLLELAQPLQFGSEIAPIPFANRVLQSGEAVKSHAFTVGADGSVSVTDIDATVQPFNTIHTNACSDRANHFLDDTLHAGAPIVSAGSLVASTHLARCDGWDPAYVSLQPMIAQLDSAMATPAIGYASGTWRQYMDSVLYASFFRPFSSMTNEQQAAGNFPLISLRGDRGSEKAAVYTNLVPHQPGDWVQVYLYYPGATPKLADAMHWRAQLGAPAEGTNEDGTCSGVSASTSWRTITVDTIAIDIDTRACGFTAQPSYFASLTNKGTLSLTYGQAQGVHAITPIRNGFRIYLSAPGLTPKTAIDEGWKVNWTGVPASSDVCHGTTATTTWVDDSPDTIYVDVDTSACKLSTPFYFTSLTGSLPTRAAGVTAIQNATPTGFRVYVTQPGLTATDAHKKIWQLHWMAGTPEAGYVR